MIYKHHLAVVALILVSAICVRTCSADKKNEKVEFEADSDVIEELASGGTENTNLSPDDEQQFARVVSEAQEESSRMFLRKAPSRPAPTPPPDEEWVRLKRGKYDIVNNIRFSGASVSFERLARHEMLNVNDRVMSTADRAELKSLIRIYRDALRKIAPLTVAATNEGVARLIREGKTLTEKVSDTQGEMEIGMPRKGQKVYNTGKLVDGVLHMASIADIPRAQAGLDAEEALGRQYAADVLRWFFERSYLPTGPYRKMLGRLGRSANRYGRDKW